MVFFTDWKSTGCRKAVKRSQCSSSFITFEALPCRIVGRMLQPHDNYSCTKFHSKWMEGCRNHRSTSGWSQRVGVTWSISRDWLINWLRRRWKWHNFQCYRGWHSSFKVEVFGGYPTWLQFSKRFWMQKWRWNYSEQNAFDAFDDKPDL